MQRASNLKIGMWKKMEKYSSITDFNCWAPARDQNWAAKMRIIERANTTDHNEHRKKSFVEIIEKNRIVEQKEQILDKKRKIWLLRTKDWMRILIFFLKLLLLLVLFIPMFFSNIVVVIVHSIYSNRSKSHFWLKAIKQSNASCMILFIFFFFGISNVFNGRISLISIHHFFMVLFFWGCCFNNTNKKWKYSLLKSLSHIRKMAASNRHLLHTRVCIYISLYFIVHCYIATWYI